MPSSEFRKRQIASRFDAAYSYDSAASTQRTCADLLAQDISAAFEGEAPASCLEIGCGTGFLTERLAALFPHSRVCATDIAPAMIARAQRRLSGKAVEFRVMDGEHPSADLPGPFALITSSLCLQWFVERREALARLAAHLAPGGRLIVATLLAGSLDEWREACREAGAPCGVAHYPTCETLMQDWPPGGRGAWTRRALVEETGSARNFLKGLRAIGASLPEADSRPASLAALRRAMDRFDRQGAAVTYQLGFGLFEKDVS